jgi:hypothetical protein
VPAIEAAADDYSRTVGVEFSAIDPRSAHAVIGSQLVRLHHGVPFWNPAVVEIAVDRAPGAPDGASREIDALGVRWRIRD